MLPSRNLSTDAVETSCSALRRLSLIILNILLKDYGKQNIFQDQTSFHHDKQHGFVKSVRKCYTYQNYTYHR